MSICITFFSVTNTSLYAMKDFLLFSLDQTSEAESIFLNTSVLKTVGDFEDFLHNEWNYLDSLGNLI